MTLLQARFSFGPIGVGIRLTAKILETSVPVFATTVFAKFPLQICFGGDLKTNPLSMALSVFIDIRICVWKCFKLTLFNAILWTFAKSPIIKELFRTCNQDSDKSPPEFKKPALEVADAPQFKPKQPLNDNVANCQTKSMSLVCSMPKKVVATQTAVTPVSNACASRGKTQSSCNVLTYNDLKDKGVSYPENAKDRCGHAESKTACVFTGGNCLPTCKRRRRRQDNSQTPFTPPGQSI